jgi:hypothetical protein
VDLASAAANPEATGLHSEAASVASYLLDRMNLMWLVMASITLVLAVL